MPQILRALVSVAAGGFEAEPRDNKQMPEPPFFYVYRDRAGEWRWRLRAAGNHEIIADSAESYITKRGAEEGAERVQSDAPMALIVTEGS